MFKNCLENVRNTVPLVHNITNYVTVNDVANVILACGGSPIMSDEAEDVEDITSVCGGLNINIGTLHKTSIEAMFRAGRRANELAHPILLDSSFRSFRFSFQDREYACDLRAVFLLTLLIGLAGGIYGIGGGSILAPLLAAGFRLPVHVTAGPTLLCTFATSAGGVLIYLLLAPLYPGLTVIPDWTLGLLFGLGGLAGMYAGARCQKYIPARPIRLLLAIVILGTAAGWLFPPR